VCLSVFTEAHGRVNPRTWPPKTPQPTQHGLVPARRATLERSSCEVKSKALWLSLRGNFVLTSLFMCADVSRRNLNTVARTDVHGYDRSDTALKGSQPARKSELLCWNRRVGSSF